MPVTKTVASGSKVVYLFSGARTPEMLEGPTPKTFLSPGNVRAATIGRAVCSEK